MRHSHHTLICLGLALAAGSWGVYWLPQRALESAGMTGGWGTIAQYVVPVVLLAPFALRRALKSRPTGLGLPLIGLLMGGGIVCYANSFLLTDVMRTLLLFYTAPLWATVLEIGVLRQRPGWHRAVSLILALIGVWLVVGGNGALPLPHNSGDWLALAGGAMFASGAARLQVVQPEGVIPLLFAFFFYGGLVAVAQYPLLANELGPLPPADVWIDVAPWFVLLSVGFFIPTIGMTIWSPSRLGAGLFGILILSEIVFGTVSAALWADEPFGWREAAGGSLILLAGVAEVVLSAGSRRGAVAPSG
jgi:drug/metabolite transporter (DMT)-like permease